ncbi:four-carbon acid sugar kinase family protein, partial [Candidatus Aerophobetes bacterium]|nr:four-carbon acid sugar kinase family protein [Candidatus Aerophobetes bacterium]
WETRKEQKIGILQSKINRSLASLAKYFVQSFPLAGLIATGGDTATSLLDKLGAEGVEVLQELEPLVPIAILKGIKGKELVLVTKTGGFGTEDVFLNAIDYLTKRSKKD